MRRPALDIFLAVLLVASVGASIRAQRHVGGRALDASLEVGSGGYNRARLGRPFLQKPAYLVSGTGALHPGTLGGFGRVRTYQPIGTARYQSAYDLRRGPTRSTVPAAPTTAAQPGQSFLTRYTYDPRDWTVRGAGASPVSPERIPQDHLALGAARPYTPGGTTLYSYESFYDRFDG